MHSNAVAMSALITAVFATAGALALALVARHRPSVAALGAPVVVVASLATGVAAATRSMVLASDDYRTVLFVLAAGAPTAVLIGVILARRVAAMQRQADVAMAAAERDAQVERSRRQLIQWLSHDLRTPLSGVRLIAESLHDNAISDVHGAYQRVLVEVDRMDTMVDDISALSRLQGSMEPKREETDFNDLVSDVVASVQPLANSAGVSVAADVLAGGPIRLDTGQVTRAVTNIVRNAVQNTPKQGRVTLSTRTTGDVAEIVVSDSCGGIDPENLDRMFEAGWRADPSRQDGGMGLGLAIARAVARAHGGEVSVQNLPDGTGCAVRARFPGAALA